MFNLATAKALLARAKTHYKIAIGVAVLIVTLVIMLCVVPSLLKKRVEGLMTQSGFNVISLGYDGKSKGQYIFTDIMLSENGGSKIGKLKADADIKGLITSIPLIKSITVEDAHLNGSWQPNAIPTIEGWDMPKESAPLNGFQNLFIDSSTITLDTPLGALRLNAKGKISKQDKNQKHIEATLAGKQQQLTFTASLNGISDEKGNWTAEIETQDARLNLSLLKISKFSGWLTLDNKFDAAAQFNAEQLQIARTTSLFNTSLTFKGTPAKYNILIKSFVGAKHDIILTTEITKDNENIRILAGLESKNIESLLSFLKNLNTDLQNFETHQSQMTSLLLTEGNFNRIRKQLKTMKYDHLELILSGTPNNLTGKILARTLNGGVYQTNVVSLNPG